MTGDFSLAVHEYNYDDNVANDVSDIELLLS